MKKLSDINESLWKSGIRRAKSGEERLEDKVNSNIDKLDLNKIDLGSECPFYISNEDLKIDGRCSWLYDEIFPYEEYFEKHGWRIPTKQEILKCFYEDDEGECISGRKFIVELNKERGVYDVYLIPKMYGKKIEFLYGNDINGPYMNRRYYWLKDDEDDTHAASLLITPEDAWGKYDAIKCKSCVKTGNVYRRIRLVKDKK